MQFSSKNPFFVKESDSQQDMFEIDKVIRGQLMTTEKELDADKTYVFYEQEFVDAYYYKGTYYREPTVPLYEPSLE